MQLPGFTQPTDEVNGWGPDGHRQAFHQLADHALLSRLVTRMRSEDPEAHAMAGIYLELSGDTRLADEHFQKAGAEITEILGSLFE